MIVRFRPLARRDLKRHFRYIHQFNPDAAWAFRAAAFTTIKQIARHPAIGHQMDFDALPACAAWSLWATLTILYSGENARTTSKSSASFTGCKTCHAFFAARTEHGRQVG